MTAAAGNMYEKYCDICKTSLSDFYRTGMLGCPNCYKVFGKELAAVLIEIQGTDRHVGKQPKIQGLNKELLSEYERLKEEKELAGLEGRFSEMAELTREIFDLQAELERRGLI